jgi:hypothetical protein
VNDKRIRRLRAMAGVIERNGPSHFTFIARELDQQLPEDYRLSERDVHSWLGRYPGIFVWAGPGIYGLKSQDVGIRADRERTALDAGTRERKTRRRGIADEIESLLQERGELSLEEIEAHVLARFRVQRSSVLAAVVQDRASRFELRDGTMVLLAHRGESS